VAQGELVAQGGGRLVGERGAADVDEQRGVEGVAHVVLGQAQAAGAGGGHHARPHGVLRRQPEPEVRDHGEGGDEVGEAEPMRHSRDHDPR
jgi:hypothetical protein